MVSSQQSTVSEKEIKKAKEILEIVKKEVSKLFVCKDNIIEKVIICLLSKGHILLEGHPGTGKTVLARTFSEVCNCTFKRVQFTADLLPSDILGLTAYDEKKGFYTVKGPIFTNILLADEINRAPSKTQSAMLEAMQEKKVTLGNLSFKLDEPFMVIATQNPIESYGTYNLPEAELDRFLFKLTLTFPSVDEELKILETNISTRDFSSFNIKQVLDKKQIFYLQNLTLQIYASLEVKEYIIRIVDAIRNPKNYGLKYAEYMHMGISPRASINMLIASKANALIDGKSYITPQNVKNVAYDIISHRLFLTYDAEPEGITHEMVIIDLLSKVKIK